jgi:hypothetical protein
LIVTDEIERQNQRVQELETAMHHQQVQYARELLRLGQAGGATTVATGSTAEADAELAALRAQNAIRESQVADLTKLLEAANIALPESFRQQNEQLNRLAERLQNSESIITAQLKLLALAWRRRKRARRAARRQNITREIRERQVARCMRDYHNAKYPPFLLARPKSPTTRTTMRDMFATAHARITAKTTTSTRGKRLMCPACFTSMTNQVRPCHCFLQRR